MYENNSHADEVRNLKQALEDAQALLAGAQRDLQYEQESARKVESQYLDAKNSLTQARNVFETIFERGDIDFEEDSDYSELASLLGFDPMVEVWITVKAEWSQKVSLPRGYDESKINITTTVDDYLTVEYDGNELDDELSSDLFEVEVNE